MSFTIGQKVQWASQSGGYTKTKIGIIAEVVPAGMLPSRDKFLYLYKSAGIGMTRNYESYVVMVGTRPYWPRANKLEFAGCSVSPRPDSPFHDDHIAYLQKTVENQKVLIKLLAKFYNATQDAIGRERQGHHDGWEKVTKLTEQIDDTIDLSSYEG